MARQDSHTLDIATALGYTATQTRGGHLRFSHPAVPHPVFSPSTPSCYRGRKNLIAQLRRELRRATATEDPAIKI